jgi:hypothetical protein
MMFLLGAVMGHCEVSSQGQGGPRTFLPGTTVEAFFRSPGPAEGTLPSRSKHAKRAPKD